MDFKYPYTDYHELNLDWFLSEFKNLVDIWARTQQDWISMQEYIRDYFDNLNVQTEIDNKIDAMIQDGTFGTIVEPYVTAALPAMVAGQLPDVVAAQIGAVVAAQIGAVVAGQLPAVAAAAAAEEVGTWLAAHIDPDTGYVIDDTLTVQNAAADAKSVGDAITDLRDDFDVVTQKSKNLISGYISSASITSSGKVTSNTGTTVYYAPITSGKKYAITSDQNLYALFTSVPEMDSVAYDNTRHSDSNVFTSPITGYCAFRTSDSFAYAQIEEGEVVSEYQSPSWLSANDKTARRIISDIITTVYGDIENITPSAPVTGSYYTGDIGDVISTVSGSGSIYAAIDLSAYVGKNVRVKYDSENTGSGRICAMCDSNGVINEKYTEKDIIKKGCAVFSISEDYNMLYVSYGTGVTGLSIDILEADNILNSLSSDTVFVSSTKGSDDNDGSLYTPFATIQKAVNSGVENVKVEAGEYAGFYFIDRIKPLKISLWDMGTYDSSTQQYAPKIKITSSLTTTSQAGSGIFGLNSAGIIMHDVWVDGVDKNCAIFDHVEWVECHRCIFSNNRDLNSMGLLLRTCNGVIRDCEAHHVVKDGFNIHGLGDTQFINCYGHDNGDDGISHHDGCTGMILGGEYCNNVKGGIISAYGGALVNVYDAYIHDNNKWGIYAGFTDTSLPTSHAMMSNCVLKNNREYDIKVEHGDLIAWNNIYDTKQVDSTYTEYSN